MPEDLEEAARRVVHVLDASGDASRIDKSVEGWNEAFVAAISTHKEQFRSSKDLKALLRIAGELLYGRDIHWAMELVQNAEDAGARRLVFVFEPDRILVWNDGVAFGAADVWAICSAGHSAKRNKIGFFGIGFKSVYKVTAAPEIYSGPYALRIEEKLYPVPLARRRAALHGAWFVLPVLPEQQSGLPAMLAALASEEFAQVLLTLTSLEQIRVIDRTGEGQSGRFRRTPLRRDQAHGWDECEIGGSWDWSETRQWRRFFRETGPVPLGLVREGRTVEPGDTSLIILARPIAGSADDVAMRIHCFLPTAVRSELRWLVQGDFEPSASREQLRESKWNDWLMGEVGEALAHAVRVSARALQEPPWDLVALDSEVHDRHQRVALDRVLPQLRQSAFVDTKRGWRRPGESTWEYYAGLGSVIREADLQLACHRDVSYVRDLVLGPISSAEASRAEQVLEQLGARAVTCDELVSLFDADDADFYRVRRDASWWLRALSLMAEHADDDQKDALARTRCLPVRGGGRVSPSPEVDDAGYLVAFSRSDIGEDLRQFLGESQVFLLDSYLVRQAGNRPRRSSRGGDDVLRAIAAMLEAEPFNVAPEAGPYHVVANLVLPRMAALRARGSLSDEDAQRAWRMFEYVRQKWPTYVSEYRRRRSDRATDVSIAEDLGDKLLVVAHPMGGADRSARLRPLAETYVSSRLVGFDAMDVALAGDEKCFAVSEVHENTLRAKLTRRGGRARTKAPEIVPFLVLLGAPIGPRVEAARQVEVRPSAIPWVDWSDIHPGARGRVGLSGDTSSPDIDRLMTRWPALSARGRAKRSLALYRAIERDWSRLAQAATARAEYFFYQWTHYRTAPATWVGRLRMVQWMPSMAGTSARPTDLVLDTPNNRLALGGVVDGVLGWKVADERAVIAIGVAARPSADRVIDVLAELRGLGGRVSAEDTASIARACYQTLADHLRDGGDPTFAKHIAARMRGGSGRGLVYAPPPEGMSGESWWPPSRVLQSDALKWAGPYVGHLANRYRNATALWDALGLKRDLTVELAGEIIQRDVAADPDPARALEYYGRLVSFINDRAAGRDLLSDIPALTSQGWRPSREVRWSNRPEILRAMGSHIPLWQPGSRDPSSLRTGGRRARN